MAMLSSVSQMYIFFKSYTINLKKKHTKTYNFSEMIFLFF